MYQPKLIVIVGPTASGKSSLSVALAKKFNGEIVSADSRQVYRDFDIGSGKITAKEMQGIPHHLIDVANPKRTFTVKQYVQLAEKAVADILGRGKTPIICGGTGFYIQALVDGITIPEVPPNLALRSRLAKKSAEALFELLKERNPERAATIERYNKRRLIRALEIVSALGKVPKLRASPKYNALFIGIKKSPEELKRLIKKRLLARLSRGMVAEVRHLHRNGLSWKRLESLGLEYRSVAQYLQGKLPYDEMVSHLERAIWHYAKRQLTWFKRDARIYWIKTSREAVLHAKKFIAPSKA
ncbi:MAG: tRNA (adenosine(37)-N6)-dimethylallyltransferase MiaA [Parcubacteria group bacterium]|nr:tRNA (adenosine(37)-N6)-dimethylallyltransferase MiaA [Parcubacteria group bacterium]